MSRGPRFQLTIKGETKEQERVLYELPTEPIRTAFGSVLPPSILTAWDDVSLAAVGIKRIELGDD